MPFLDASQAKMFYVQSGAGPHIVWLSGGESVADDWVDQILVFVGQYGHTSSDPRGAGRTVSRRQPPWLIEEFAKDYAHLLRAVCKPPVYLVGLSMGSLIVIQMCLDHPELVRTGIAMGVSGRAEGFLRDW